MDAYTFVRTCQERNPIELFDTALGIFSKELPEELYDNFDILMTIEMLADTLFEEKEFDKAEQFVAVLHENQPELYQDSLFYLLPNLIYYHLFRGSIDKVEYYMSELAIAPEEDFLLFVHLLDVLDAYGLQETMNQIVTDVLTIDTHLDEEDQLLLESFLVAVEADTEDERLKAIRQSFLNRAPYFFLPNVTAENIIDAMINYFDHNIKDDSSDKLLIDEESFRQYITSLLDIEFLDTYEYASSVIWGSVYLIDMLGANGVLSAEETSYNLEIIKKMKAFFMVNIPWDGYWRLKFLYNWARPWSISAEEFNAEHQLIMHNLFVRPREIVNNSILNIFGKETQHITYAKYLEDEQAAFNKSIEENIELEFGTEKKRDSLFPSLNFLSGEQKNELKPMPSNFCDNQSGKGGNECCTPDINPV